MNMRTPVAAAGTVAALLLYGTAASAQEEPSLSGSEAYPAEQQQPYRAIPEQVAPGRAAPAQTGQPRQATPGQERVVRERQRRGEARPGTTTTTGARYHVQQAPTAYGIPSGQVVERTVEQRPNSDMLSTGVGLFILSYGASVVAGAESTRDADKRLFIPVAGPWLNLQDRGCTDANPCGPNEGMARALIVTSGIVQGFGALLTLGAFLVPETTTTHLTPVSTPPRPSVRVTPMSFPDGAGVAAVGRF